MAAITPEGHIHVWAGKPHHQPIKTAVWRTPTTCTALRWRFMALDTLSQDHARQMHHALLCDILATSWLHEHLAAEATVVANVKKNDSMPYCRGSAWSRKIELNHERPGLPQVMVAVRALQTEAEPKIGQIFWRHIWRRLSRRKLRNLLSFFRAPD